MPGRLDDAREHRRLGERELRDRLAEVDLRRRLHAVRAVTEVDGVQVQLEDLVLGELLLEAVGEDRPPSPCAVSVFSRCTKAFLTYCCVMVEPPVPLALGDVDEECASDAQRVDAPCS